VYLVEIFLPLERSDATRVTPDEFEQVLSGLTDRFGGATAFMRAPATGLWKTGTQVEEDRIVIVEVLVADLGHEWWVQYRKQLESDFMQQHILIRASQCVLL
jgi:hypothetical protein